MLGRQSPQDVIDSYKKKRPFFPIFIAILAVLLVLIGIAIIVMWLTGGGLSLNLFKKEPTPTSTMPPTPVISPTATFVPTETPTPTLTVSPTASGPFEYEVKEGDNCWTLSETYEVDLEVLLAINNFENGTCPIYPGLKIKIPAPGTTLPTPTPIPPDTKSGTKILYRIQSGDSLLSIASKFNTTVEDLIRQNKFDDPNNITPGVEIIVRVNLVTPTPTFAPTSTLAS
ncbi:MAG: LysM peptidoglycan-binding domain-containing protein [Pelolinea sp.]|nr:LysM peptidoglycan-binding domain-containing protein [Pelolinea sp.]